MEVPAPRNLSIRIHRDASSVEVQTFMSYAIKQWKCDVIGVQHDADEEVKRTHVHIVLRNIKLTGDRWTDTVRDAIRKNGLKGNEDYRSELCRSVDLSLVYNSKGKLWPFTPMAWPEFTEQYWLEIQSRFVQPVKKLKLSQLKAQAHKQIEGSPTPFNEIVANFPINQVSDSVVNRVTKYQLFCEMVSEVEIQARDKQITAKSYEYTKLLVDTTISVLKNYRQKFPRYTVRDFTDMLRFDEKSNRDELYKFCDL